MNIVELQRILNERKRQLDKLMRRREKLQKQVDAIDAEIGKVAGDGLGGGGGGNGRAGGGNGSGAGGRAKNDRPLPDYIEEVMGKNGKPMRVGEIVDAVKSAGYKSNSASFKNIVNQMLIKEKKRFKQISRGVYGMKK